MENSLKSMPKLSKIPMKELSFGKVKIVQSATLLKHKHLQSYSKKTLSTF